ncbi:DUF6270 domain-containing protein [Ensifer sp. BR816]|uniref:DUF6270 domain-containing protein n=1 Tax=Rhizobium sp. (strain BR816) TaxID=1057002 RepID=UPI00036FF4AC|nr:DUF6270 domain-containing protein [Ensifer sp. BR816]
MTQTQVAILGSCVTRDAFEHLNEVEISFYLARSSLTSIYAPPWDFTATDEELQVEGKGVFENRMLRHDLRKEAAGIIRVSADVPLVVDFIDERFDLFLAGGSVITRSNLLQLTPYGRRLEGVQLLRRVEPEAMHIWEQAALRFLGDLQGRPLILHRALWAECYRNDDTGEISRFGEADLKIVMQQNQLLNKYYDFITTNYTNVQTVAPAPELVYSNFAHRWGRDFFHFSDDYYRDIAGKIATTLVAKRQPATNDRDRPMAPSACLSDRDLLHCDHFSLSGSPGSQPLDAARLNCGPGRVTVGADHVAVAFGASGDGAAISQQLRFTVPDASHSNGVGVRVRLRGWVKISYIAIGHTEDGTYHHAKAAHPLQDEWFDFCVGLRDLAWGWRNGWNTPQGRPISDVRFYIRGVPGRDAGCDISDIWLWQEADQPDRVFDVDQPIPSEVVSKLIDYQRACFPDYIRLARNFMASGRCPLAGNTLLDWPLGTPLPPQLQDNGTYQYSWHSQHPAVLLMLLHTDANEIGPLFSARDFVTDWLERSFDKPDSNIKYAWYDHGVAERTFAMVTLYALGQKHGFDARFMTRLRRAIHRHAQLLASLVFYASHQPIRYHNHAWFQDLALMTVGLAFPGWACADLWVETALARAKDQFAQLIARDGDFAVFAENSIGYHLGIERVVATIGAFAALSGRETEIPLIATELSRFSALMRYPDGQRTLAQGDTFRRSNSPVGDPDGRKPYGRQEISILPRAGYAIAKADHSGRPFMLVFLATSLAATHKHADNLSFTLYFDGIEWLIDPSFYSHEYARDLPRYLRGPEAHNAFVLPGANYAIEPGLARLWGKEIPGGFVFEGSHTAVRDVEIHRRIEGATDRLDLQLRETLHNGANLPASARLMLHCGEGVEVKIENDGLRLAHPATELSLQIVLPPGCDVHLFHGRQEDPIRGVTGVGFLQSEPITTIEIAPPSEVNALVWRLRAV